MKIHIPDIPEEGQSILLSEKEPWVRRLMAESLPDLCDPGAKLRGELRLQRTHENVSLHGSLILPIRLACDRCAKPFVMDLDLDLVRHLSPYFGEPGEREGDEVELAEEDMEFSFYHGEEIDLSNILVEEILLAVPMGHFCREDCKGLCTKCGADLNEARCACSDARETSPFAALKNRSFPTGKL